MPQTIFYSWQSDLPNKTNRSFIQEALEKAIKEIADTDLENADRPETETRLELDKDTKGVTGSPPIVETIFGKIEKATIFVPDLTFVASSDKRQVSNPNVLIEYGYALKTLGHSKIIPIMNEAYGEANDRSLPFDMKHLRWPRTYNLSPDNTDSDKKRAEMKSLVKYLVNEIRQILDNDNSSSHTDPLKGYVLAQEILKGENRNYLWNQSLKSSRKEAKSHLTNLASSINTQVSNANTNEILEQALSGVSDWISFAMGGVEACENPFNQQIQLLDELLIIDGWPRYGNTAIVDIPFSIAYAYQAVFGASCTHSNQIDLVFQLSQAQVPESRERGKSRLIENNSIFGYPKSVGENMEKAWEFLKALPDESWPWLSEFFGNKNEYVASLCAYYMTMDVFELIRQLNLNIYGDSHGLVSLCFVKESDEILDQAKYLFDRNLENIIKVADYQGVSITKIQKEWPNWSKRANDFIWMLSLPSHPHPYKDLCKDLEKYI
jgi:hypothetical protein